MTYPTMPCLEGVAVVLLDHISQQAGLDIFTKLLCISVNTRPRQLNGVTGKQRLLSHAQNVGRWLVLSIQQVELLKRSVSLWSYPLKIVAMLLVIVFVQCEFQSILLWYHQLWCRGWGGGVVIVEACQCSPPSLHVHVQLCTHSTCMNNRSLQKGRPICCVPGSVQPWFSLVPSLIRHTGLYDREISRAFCTSLPSVRESLVAKLTELKFVCKSFWGVGLKQ